MSNPFQLTRAADLDDDQTIRLWVDPQKNLGTRLRPSSALPMFILGGRGSGKTHLMRYFSYTIQRKIHGPDAMIDRIAKDKYIGIHTRCMGLNTSRFSGKRMEDAKWQDLFAYYLELWFGQMILQAATLFIEDSQITHTYDEVKLVRRVVDLFDVPLNGIIHSVEDFGQELRRLQKNLDNAINLASFKEPEIPEINVSPGRLTFGIAKAFAELVPAFKGIMFTIFIDEYEHLFEAQQKHVNTLIRERENPVSFKVGARLHGLRTHKTWGGDEELKEGSDYELLNLDKFLRGKSSNYEAFALDLCVARIRFHLNGLPEDWTEQNAAQKFQNCFELPTPQEERIAAKVSLNKGIAPWLLKLEFDLEKLLSMPKSLGLTQELDVKEVVDLLHFPENLLVEKTNTFLLYRAWKDKKNLKVASRAIKDSAKNYLLNGDKATLHGRCISHFSEDLLTQMQCELELSRGDLLQNYIGIKDWIKMSDGIARNLITTLRRVFDWAAFRDEQMYHPFGISVGSQTKGVDEASKWFMNDAHVLGTDRGMVETGMKRIATFLRAIRLSSKPPECSLCRFSLELSGVDEISKSVIQAAEMWSLLIQTRDRKDRNTSAHKVQFKVNGLITPDYDLPFSARGSVHLTKTQVAAIFGTKDEGDFNRILAQRLARCNAPFSDRSEERNSPNKSDNHNELDLF